MRRCNSISSTKRQCTRNADRILCTDLSDHIDVVSYLYTTLDLKERHKRGKKKRKRKQTLREF